MIPIRLFYVSTIIYLEEKFLEAMTFLSKAKRFPLFFYQHFACKSSEQNQAYIRTYKYATRTHGLIAQLFKTSELRQSLAN